VQYYIRNRGGDITVDEGIWLIKGEVIGLEPPEDAMNGFKLPLDALRLEINEGVWTWHLALMS
jgi:hypothetical protein